MPARSVCLVALSLSEAGPGRFGRQVSVIDIYHTIPYHTSTTYWYGPTHLFCANGCGIWFFFSVELSAA